MQYSTANQHWAAYITVTEKNSSEEIAVWCEMVHYYHKNHTEVILGFVRHLMGRNSIEDNLSSLLQHNSIRLGDVQKLVSFKAAQIQHIA